METTPDTMETPAYCEGCSEWFDIEVAHRADQDFYHDVVKLGDGTIDDEFYICPKCVDRARRG